jgi:hypothetical protein
MVDAKQQGTQSLSWFRLVSRTSSSSVLKALYCSAPGVPIVGLLQARRERKRSFQVSGVVAEGVMLRCVVCVLRVSLSVPSVCPLRLGGSPPFYRSRRERITCAPCYLAT